MENKKINFTQRRGYPQTMGAVFGGFLSLFGVRAGASDLSERWGEIVGDELSKIATLYGIRALKNKQFNITLRAINPAAKTELSYRLPEFSVKINHYFGYDAVAKITIR
ncbi:MAG: DUF721 domain-containing protein [Rickettsiales bacterium]|jgi:hypothetical protein|nr:DUF721 domain-containing protein [Rickettsiales bacterium]